MNVVDEFKAELEAKAKSHNWSRKRNAFLHQFLIILAALADVLHWLRVSIISSQRSPE